MPTLEAALELIDALGLFANLEIKPQDRPLGATAAAVARALRRRPWARQRIVVSSFDLDELSAFREAMPEAPVAVLYTRPPRDWLARLTALRAEALHLRFDKLHAESAGRGARCGLSGARLHDQPAGAHGAVPRAG